MYLIATAEALAAQVTEENYEKGLIYPPFSNIRKISANIAAKVAAKSYELGELLRFWFCLSSKFSVKLIGLTLLSAYSSQVWLPVSRVLMILLSMQRAACILQSTAIIADHL